MTRVGRPPSCLCGDCVKCVRNRRRRERERYQALSHRDRREMVARRDVERVRADDRARGRTPERKAAHATICRRKGWPDKRAFRERYPEKYAAHSAVLVAVRSGRLLRRPCEVCGTEPAHAHHDDYSKPLDVRWLCPAHHGEEHRVYK